MNTLFAKFLLLTIGALFAFGGYSQTVLKVDFNKYKKTDTSYNSSALKDSVDKANAHIDKLRQNPNETARIDSITKILQPFKSLSFIKSELNLLQTAKLTELSGIPTVSIPIPAGSNSGSSLSDKACPRIANIAALKFLPGSAADSYIGVLQDSNDNPLESFVIIQLNRDLFYDKLKKALTNLCSDGSAIDTILNSFKKIPDLYTQFLEAKESVANTDNLAGILIIHKKTILHVDSTGKKVSSATKGETAAITSIKVAKKEAQKAMETATTLTVKLEKMALDTAAFQPLAKGDNQLLFDRINTLSKKSRTIVDSAQKYFDSINNKIPDSKILDYYNKAIQLFRQVTEASDRAKEEIKKASQITNNLENQSSRRSSSPEWEMPIYTPVLAANTITATLSSTQYMVDAPSPEPSLYSSVALPYNEYSNALPAHSSPAFTIEKEESSIAPEVDTQGADSVVTGTLTYNKSFPFTIYEVQIQFQDGFIENIKLFGKKEGDSHLLRFENIYPISFSTKRDFHNFSNIQLWEKSDQKEYKNLYLVLSDFMSYNQNLVNDNKDYSPANQILNIRPLTENVKEIALYKEQTSRILEAKVFSDLKGTDSNNPNGLIQIELSKRLNFLSKRRSFGSIGNIGFFNYVTPKFSLNKIEDNQKRLVLNHIDTLSLAADTSRGVTYASTINLLRHQVYHIGFDLSVFLLDVPALKSTFNAGVGAYWGRTAIQDTLRRRSGTDPNQLLFTAAPTNTVLQYGINTFQWGPFFTWQIFPDGRFGVSATQRFTWYKALTSDFIQVRDSAHYLRFVSSIDKKDIRNTSYRYFDYGSRDNWVNNNIFSPASIFTKCIATSEIFAHCALGDNTNNKLFFRYRMNWDLLTGKENFHQVQVGFSTCITTTKEYDKLKTASGVEW